MTEAGYIQNFPNNFVICEESWDGPQIIIKCHLCLHDFHDIAPLSQFFTQFILIILEISFAKNIIKLGICSAWLSVIESYFVTLLFSINYLVYIFTIPQQFVYFSSRVDGRYFFRVLPRLVTVPPPGMAPCAVGSIVEVLVSATGNKNNYSRNSKHYIINYKVPCFFILYFPRHYDIKR